MAGYAKMEVEAWSFCLLAAVAVLVLRRARIHERTRIQGDDLPRLQLLDRRLPDRSERRSVPKKEMAPNGANRLSMPFCGHLGGTKGHR